MEDDNNDDDNADYHVEEEIVGLAGHLKALDVLLAHREFPKSAGHSRHQLLVSVVLRVLLSKFGKLCLFVKTCLDQSHKRFQATVGLDQCSCFFLL